MAFAGLALAEVPATIFMALSPGLHKQLKRTLALIDSIRSILPLAIPPSFTSLFRPPRPISEPHSLFRAHPCPS